jgi:hypothetical protein
VIDHGLFPRLADDEADLLAARTGEQERPHGDADLLPELEGAFIAAKPPQRRRLVGQDRDDLGQPRPLKNEM